MKDQELIDAIRDALVDMPHLVMGLDRLLESSLKAERAYCLLFHIQGLLTGCLSRETIPKNVMIHLIKSCNHITGFMDRKEQEDLLQRCARLGGMTMQETARETFINASKNWIWWHLGRVEGLCNDPKAETHLDFIRLYIARLEKRAEELEAIV